MTDVTSLLEEQIKHDVALAVFKLREKLADARCQAAYEYFTGTDCSVRISQDQAKRLSQYPSTDAISDSLTEILRADLVNRLYWTKDK